MVYEFRLAIAKRRNPQYTRNAFRLFMLTFLALCFFAFEYPLSSGIVAARWIELTPASVLCFDLGHIGSTVVYIFVVYFAADFRTRFSLLPSVFFS